MKRSLLFAFGALALFSCKDDGNTNPIEPQSSNPQVPTASARSTKVYSLKVPEMSAQAKAEASKIDAAQLELTTAAAKHDPTLFLGMAVQCLSGAEATGEPTFGGTSTKFANGRGCEHNTFDGDADPNNAAAFSLPSQSSVRGRRLDHTTRLEFTYAGGPPSGGNPRWSLSIDTCTPTTQPTAAHDCDSGTATDGKEDETAFIDALGCNDGDAFVGTVKPRAPAGAGGSDPSCIVSTSGGESFPNWAAYVAARVGARWSTNGFSFVITDQPSHYLIYRVFLRARL